jgi:hypothetical protein
LRWAACAAFALQLAHCGEEYATGLPRRFPAALGLMPWSDRFFLAFNATWLLVWALAIAALFHRPHAARRARGAVVSSRWRDLLNALAHPLLALRVGGYFPGW